MRIRVRHAIEIFLDTVQYFRRRILETIVVGQCFVGEKNLQGIHIASHDWQQHSGELDDQFSLWSERFYLSQ
jgi:hypothetical protein